MNKIKILVLIALFLSSGCSALPFDQPTKQERPVNFIADNEGDATRTFEVSVVELPANVTIRRSDGLVETFELGGGVSTNDPGDNRSYTEVEVPDTTRLHGRFTVEPGESNQSPIKDLPRNFALVVAVYVGENEINSFVTATCDDLALAKLRVTGHSYGASATWSCVPPD